MKTYRDALASEAVTRVESMDHNTEQLGKVASEIAMRAAAEYLAIHRLEADPEALVACLRSWVKVKLREALRDAREAIAAGMPQAAEATFKLSLAQAGIEAAREAGFPKGTR